MAETGLLVYSARSVYLELTPVAAVLTVLLPFAVASLPAVWSLLTW